MTRNELHHPVGARWAGGGKTVGDSPHENRCKINLGNTGMQPNLAGKVALVTGASSGIGRAAAVMLAEAGCDVAMNYYSLPEAAEEAARTIRAFGRQALPFPVDIADQTAVEAMVKQTVAELGRLDIFVSLRGLQRPRAIPQQPT